MDDGYENQFGGQQLDISNNLDNIDDLTGMSAMEGINRLNTMVSEVNLTVSKIGQDYEYQSGPISGSGQNSADAN